MSSAPHLLQRTLYTKRPSDSNRVLLNTITLRRQRGTDLGSRSRHRHSYSLKSSNAKAGIVRNASGLAKSSGAPFGQGWGQNSIFVSLSDDPYFNLSLEDVLFRKHDVQKPLLLMYRDKPCVVIGRNQNPWKEVNLKEGQRIGVPFIRRKSGGGTVYHDLGNTNFSIHLPRSSFDRNITGQTVLRAVRSLGIDARLNSRNDICVGSEKISLRCIYVSGSAYKIVNNRAYHHGTMLISTQLDTLGDLLRVPGKDMMVTKGVASVRSPVCNLRQFNRGVTHDSFVNAVVRQFREDFGADEEPVYVPDSEEYRTDPDIRKGMEELPTWGWAFGQTPEFTYEVQQAFSWGEVKLNLRSKHGIVLECAGQLSEGTLDETGDIADFLLELSGSIVGQRYGFLEMDSALKQKAQGDTTPELGAVVKDIEGWIAEIA